jgi:hypothetical protein
MLAGLRDAEVAEGLAVNRTTVWRWRREDLAFQAELNRRRYEIWNSSVERLRSLVPAALDALAEELEGPRRLRAAATVLELAGFRARAKAGIDVSPTGATTPEALEEGRRRSAELQDLLNPVLR